MRCTNRSNPIIRQLIVKLKLLASIHHITSHSIVATYQPLTHTIVHHPWTAESKFKKVIPWNRPYGSWYGSRFCSICYQNSRALLTYSACFHNRIADKECHNIGAEIRNADWDYLFQYWRSWRCQELGEEICGVRGCARAARGTAASEEGRSQGVDSLGVNVRFVEDWGMGNVGCDVLERVSSRRRLCSYVFRSR